MDMDYATLSTRELQEECKRRGLPSGRAKAELTERLLAHDAAARQPDASTPAPGGTPTPTPPGDRSDTPTPTVPGAHRERFPAGLSGPDEAEHLAYRQATIQAARAAGHVPRGDAYRIGTVDGHEVYEVRLRQVS